MKKILLALLVLTSVICPGPICGGVEYNYHNRQHIKIYFNDGTKVSHDSDNVGEWTEYREDDGMREKHHTQANIYDPEYMCVWDEIDNGGGDWKDMLDAYTTIYNDIRNLKHTVIFDTNIEEGEDGHKWHTVYISLLKDEVKEIKIN